MATFYHKSPAKVKENIVLKNKLSIEEDIVFDVETNLELEKLDDESIIAKKDNLILPMDPIKEGYKFIGWFNTKGKQVYGGEEIKTDIVNIFAKYEKIDNKTK